MEEEDQGMARLNSLIQPQVHIEAEVLEDLADLLNESGS